MKNILDFKTARQYSEWYDGKLEQRIKTYITWLGLYSWTEFNKRLCITSIYRTKEEDKKLKASGIHNSWRGVDIRTNIYSELEINKMVTLCNEFLHYDSENMSRVAVYGDKRHKDHIHVQIGWRV